MLVQRGIRNIYRLPAKNITDWQTLHIAVGYTVLFTEDFESWFADNTFNSIFSEDFEGVWVWGVIILTEDFENGGW